MSREKLWRIALSVAIAPAAAGVLVTAVSSGYCCGYLTAWRELQLSPPVFILDEAVVTEAVELCRVLVAEFPEEPDYKSRLAYLLKLQAEHCKEQGTSIGVGLP